LTKLVIICSLLSLLSACSDSTKQSDAVDQSTIRFAIIGDYGNPDNKFASIHVSDLVKSWRPQFIATVGDNNYPSGEASTIDANVGQYYSYYMHPYKGSYGKGSPDGKNHFYPAIGNHDYYTDLGSAHFDYFNFSDNQAYYDVNLGLVHLIIMDSNLKEESHPDSPQGKWVKNILQTSSAQWKLVLLHHPPSSSGRSGGFGRYRWSFRDWGATAVIAGHEHFYERMDHFGIPYFINGLGGAGIHKFRSTHEQSIIRYNDKYGAMRVTADNANIRFEFINIDNKVIDRFDFPPME